MKNMRYITTMNLVFSLIKGKKTARFVRETKYRTFLPRCYAKGLKVFERRQNPFVSGV